MRARAHTLAPAVTAQLSVKDVTKSYGPRTILDQVTFTVRPGERAAVIGENGAGKSTLLRLLAGAETPDDGEITAAFPGGTGHLTQTPYWNPAGPCRTRSITRSPRCAPWNNGCARPRSASAKRPRPNSRPTATC